jgi:hypothetical protein
VKHHCGVDERGAGIHIHTSLRERGGIVFLVAVCRPGAQQEASQPACPRTAPMPRIGGWITSDH